MPPALETKARALEHFSIFEPAMDLLSYLNTIITVSSPLKSKLKAISRKVGVEKSEILLNCNERCKNLYFIESGLLRGFYFQEDKEITSWFARDGEFASSFYSFISGESSIESIQALEDSELVIIPHMELQKLYLEFPETERIGRILTETYYLKLENRLISLQFKTARERYLNLLKNQAPLVEKAPLGHIASYLGITQETLSRIRSEK